MWMVASPAFRNFVFIVLLLIGGGHLVVDRLFQQGGREKADLNAPPQEYIAATAIKLADLKTRKREP